MAEEDGGAEQVIDERLEFDGTYVEIEAFSVPPSSRFPEGVKYSMQYGTTDGETIIRYDNHPDYPGVGRHHRHGSSDPHDVEEIEFEGLEALYRRFKREVNEHGDDW